MQDARTGIPWRPIGRWDGRRGPRDDDDGSLALVINSTGSRGSRSRVMHASVLDAVGVIHVSERRQKGEKMDEGGSMECCVVVVLKGIWERFPVIGYGYAVWVSD